MEITDYFSDFGVLYMVSGFVIGTILFLCLSIVRSRLLDLASTKTYVSADDLHYDLRRMGNEIPCAILRGHIRQRNLKILDSIYEGVLRQTEAEEVYERNILPNSTIPDESRYGIFGVCSSITRFFDIWSHIQKCFGSNTSSRNLGTDTITTVDTLESVDFGLGDIVGNKWLVEDLGPPEDYAFLMKRTSSQVTYLNCNNAIGGTYANPIIRFRTLVKVTNKSKMLIIGEPITIMGKITVSDFGNIEFSRPESSCKYVISAKSPEALSRQDSATVICILVGMLFCGLIVLYGAYKFFKERIKFLS